MLMTELQSKTQTYTKGTVYFGAVRNVLISVVNEKGKVQLSVTVTY
jgi:hypothetical protein